MRAAADPGALLGSLLPAGQIHLSLEHTPAPLETRSITRGHPCFVLPFETMAALIAKLDAFATSGDSAACTAVAQEKAAIPKEEDQDKVVDGYRRGDRFFVRDWCGNRLEFSGI